MFSATTILILTTLFYAIYKYLTSTYNYWDKKNIKSIKPQLFFGNLKDVILAKLSIGQFLANIYRSSTEDLVGIWIFRSPNLVIRSPELIKQILVQDFNYFNDRTIVSHEKADPIASKMLLMLDNPDWKIIRQRTSPAFTLSKLKKMVPLVDQCAQDMLVYLTKNNGRLNTKDLCVKYMTNVITSVGFGVDAQCFERDDADFLVVGRRMFSLDFLNSLRSISYFLIPSLVKFFRISFFTPSVYKFLRKVVWETIEAREKSKTSRNDLIDILIEIRKDKNFGNGIKFEGDMVVAQAVQFYGAGFETSGSTISFALYEMALNQNIQNKLRNELKQVVEKYGSLSYEAVLDCPYLDKVVAETLRKYPPLPFLDRRCVRDYKIPNSDIVIDKGTPVFIPLYGLHHDPKYFPEPTIFDPERFSEENISTRPIYSYMPFGHGPHNCIGEKFGLLASKLCVAHILLNYRIEQCEETSVPIIFTPSSFLLQPKSALYLRFVNI